MKKEQIWVRLIVCCETDKDLRTFTKIMGPKGKINSMEWELQFKITPIRLSLEKGIQSIIETFEPMAIELQSRNINTTQALFVDVFSTKAMGINFSLEILLKLENLKINLCVNHALYNPK
jgi:hypothetical protein